jgi:predicted secreted protein
MAYQISTAFAIYFVIWWVTLFLTLPFGVRSQHEEGQEGGEIAPGTDPGAPVATQMGRKLIWTTVISAVIFALGMLAYRAGYLSIERLSKLMGMPF